MTGTRHICAICGRATVPAVYIGAEAIGPTCARRANLLKPAKHGRVRIVRAVATKRADSQLDLLAGL